MADVREKLFVLYYLGEAEGDAGKAANLAGYNRPRARGAQLLQKPTVQEAIRDKLAAAEVGAEEVLLRLAARARSDANCFLRFSPDKENNAPYLDFRKAKALDALGAIKKIKSTRIQKDDGPPLQVVEVELFDPLAALTILAKVHGLIDRATNAVPKDSILPPKRLTIPGFDARSLPSDED